MSRQSAYRLRSRLKGQPFDLAWDVAFHHSYDNLAIHPKRIVTLRGRPRGAQPSIAVCHFLPVPKH